MRRSTRLGRTGGEGERGEGTTRPELSSEFRGRLRRGFLFQDVDGEQRPRSAIRLLRALSQRVLDSRLCINMRRVNLTASSKDGRDRRTRRTSCASAAEKYLGYMLKKAREKQRSIHATICKDDGAVVSFSG